MRILSRYFLVSYLTLFAAILLISMLAIVIIEVLLHFDDVLDHRDGFAGAATYLLLRVPSYYLRDLIPVASFAAAFFGLGLPARWREVTALKAGGISPHRVAFPVLIAAAGLSGAALVVNETLVMTASRLWNRLERDEDEISFRRGSFWYHRGDVIYNVTEADRASRTLSGVSVYELTPEGRLRRSIWAEKVEIRPDSRWRLQDATLRTFDPEAPDAPPRVERAEETVLEVAGRRDLALLSADAATLSLWNLRDYIEARGREGRDTSRYRALLHARLADPLTVLLFALLALPLGLAVERTRSLAFGALQGIAIVGAFYTVRTLATLFAAGGLVPAAASPWLLLGAFAGAGAWRFARVPR